MSYQEESPSPILQPPHHSAPHQTSPSDTQRVSQISHHKPTITFGKSTAKTRLTMKTGLDLSLWPSHHSQEKSKHTSPIVYHHSGIWTNETEPEKEMKKFIRASKRIPVGPPIPSSVSGELIGDLIELRS
ncbi:hypothetical protein GH733_012616 [Mirounga leonina]|nr:hypothetical protein GH733_012616 [Mirounga leonina]